MARPRRPGCPHCRRTTPHRPGIRHLPPTTAKPRGTFQARVNTPDGRRTSRVFLTETDAVAWLGEQAAAISRGTWTPATPATTTDSDPAPTLTFEKYAEAWLAERPLRPRTRDHYRRLLDVHLIPTFGVAPLASITPAAVRVWHADMDAKKETTRAHAYGLLRTILATAVSDGELAANPCHIRGAGTTKRARKIKPLTLAELEALVKAMPEQYKLMTLLAAWCALRFGELTELRRGDIDVTAGVIRIRRAVARSSSGEFVIGQPKSDAGVRDVAIPPHLLPMVKDHLRGNITGGKDGLLFPALNDPTRHLAPGTLYGASSRTIRGKDGTERTRPGWGFYGAREVAGRPDARWHDLRHTGAVLAAQTGATLAELMHRLGHSTPQAALIYQHTAEGRDALIADRLSAMTGWSPDEDASS